MSLSIESKIIAMLNGEHGERIPSLVEQHIKVSKEPVNWAFCDEFSQPILLRIIETLTSDLVDLILAHVEAHVIQNLKYEVAEWVSLQFALRSHSDSYISIDTLETRTIALRCTSLH